MRRVGSWESRNKVVELSRNKLDYLNKIKQGNSFMGIAL